MKKKQIESGDFKIKTPFNKESVGHPKTPKESTKTKTITNEKTSNSSDGSDVTKPREVSNGPGAGEDKQGNADVTVGDGSSRQDAGASDDDGAITSTDTVGEGKTEEAGKA